MNQHVFFYADWFNIGASVTLQSDASMHISDFKMLKIYGAQVIPGFTEW